MIKDIQLLNAEDYARIQNSKENYYPNVVECLIRKKYSLSAELAILRQRDTKPNEYEEYNTYAEQCKVVAKILLGIS